MNILKSHRFFRAGWLVLLLGVLADDSLRAASQANRFLLVFETSPSVKKNLPFIEQTLDGMFSSNFQNELGENDDLAVWTVDEEIHTASFPLASWAPEDAAMYSDRLKEFLGKQHYTRHASLAALQPLLNQVAKGSERLTILIFCDSQSRLVGTPYDLGVNGIITNAATKAKSAPFILVLRVYHGAYLGCSVNQSAPLNFPKFPPPPAPPPPPKPAPAPIATQPAPVKPAMLVAPVPALIIIGTNATTNVQALTKPESLNTASTTVAPGTKSAVITTAPPVVVSEPVPQPAVPPATNPAAVSTAAPPVIARPEPVPPPALQKTSAPELVVTAPIIVSNPPARPASNAVAVSKNVAVDTGIRWPIFAAGSVLIVAAGVIGWLVARARRPRGSLISSSMQQDPNRPRGK